MIRFILWEELFWLLFREVIEGIGIGIGRYLSRLCSSFRDRDEGKGGRGGFLSLNLLGNLL